MGDEAILHLPMTADYVRLALRLARAHGHAEERVLAGTRLSEAALGLPGARTSQRDNLTVLANLTHLLGPGWPFSVRFGPETSGPLGQAVASAPSVGDALRVLADYGQSRSPRYRLRLTRRAADLCALEGIETIRVSADARRTGEEILTQSLHNMLETLVGSDMADAVVTVRSSMPAHAALYTRAFRAQVRFAAAVAAIEFPATWLERPAPFANPHLFASARTMLEIERDALRDDGLVVAEVEQALLATHGRMPDLQAVAAVLGVSARTLTRRLQTAGTTFRTLRSTWLAQRARELLAHTSRSIESISTELGYADPVAFNLACHRWLGMAPRAWRQRARAHAGPDVEPTSTSPPRTATTRRKHA